MLTNTHPRHHVRGISLIELVVFIMVMAIGLSVLIKAISYAQARSTDPLIITQGVECARAALADAMVRKFDESTPTGGIPACGSAEFSAVACSGIAVDADLDDTGDFNGYVYTLGGCNVTLTVTGEGTDLGLPDDADEVRLITAVASMPGGDTLTLASYRTNF